MNWYAIGLKLALLLAVVGVIFGAGYKMAEDNLRPEINALKANLIAIDLKAKSDEQFYERNLNEIQTKTKDSINRINARYDRLLHSKNNSSPGDPPASAEGINEPTEESRAIGFERDCALDANHVKLFQEWIRLNQFPVE